MNTHSASLRQILLLVPALLVLLPVLAFAITLEVKDISPETVRDTFCKGDRIVGIATPTGTNAAQTNITIKTEPELSGSLGSGGGEPGSVSFDYSTSKLNPTPGNPVEVKITASAPGYDDATKTVKVKLSRLARPNL